MILLLLISILIIIAIVIVLFQKPKKSAQPVESKGSGGVSPLKTIGIVFGFIGSGIFLRSIIFTIIYASQNPFGEAVMESLLNSPKFIAITALMVLSFIGCIVAIGNQTVGGILMLIGAGPEIFGLFRTSTVSERDILPIIATILLCLGGIFVLAAPRGAGAIKYAQANLVQYCPNCGTRLESGITFCPQCGARIGS